MSLSGLYNCLEIDRCGCLCQAAPAKWLLGGALLLAITATVVGILGVLGVIHLDLITGACLIAFGAPSVVIASIGLYFSNKQR